jgi:DNA-binding IclR family transcriptional regulator
LGTENPSERSFDVLDAVHQGPGEVDIATVAARTRMSSNEAAKYLSRLARNGLLIKVRRGTYDWPGRLRDRLRDQMDGERSV